MNTSANNKFFLRWHKCKALFVRAMEVLARGQGDCCLNPYWDFPADGSFNVFKSKDSSSQNRKGPPPQAEGPSKPEVRSNPRSVYETGIVGGAVDDERHANLNLSAKSTSLDKALEAKKVETHRERMDETEATVWIMVAIILALAVVAFAVLEMKIAR